MEANSEENKNNKVKLNFNIAKVLFVFAIISLLTSFVMSFDTGQKIDTSIPSDGGTVGPFETENSSTVLNVSINQDIKSETWSFVTVELLNEDKQYLTGFGDEFYYATGYDSDGHWSEAKEDYSTKITIREAGKYYLRIKPETEGPVNSNAYGKIKVNVKSQVASSLPHTVVGIIALILSIFFWYRANATKVKEVFGD